MTFGHQEGAASIMILGFFFTLLPLFANILLIIKIFIIVGFFLILMAFIWINGVISSNGLGVLINRINPDKHEVWVRISKSKHLSFQKVKKDVYGRTKGIMQNKKADVIDKGDFPIRLKNGNPAIIAYDLMSHNVNLNEAVAWKKIFKKYKLRSGKKAYQKAVEDEEVIT